ncbi:MAG: SRPBCC family protein [Actinomadura rubrobrunea]|nr:SRPBCC family protein [Actinomadura rubrobrunea]
MRHEVVTTVRAPAELVWETIVSVERWPEWTPTVTAARRLDDGPLRVGARTEVAQPGQPSRVWVVTELRDGASFTWSSGGRALRLTAGHAVRPGEDGEVAVALSFAVSGPLAPLAALTAGRTIRRLLDTEAESLKRWCEKQRA